MYVNIVTKHMYNLKNIFPVNYVCIWINFKKKNFKTPYEYSILTFF